MELYPIEESECQQCGALSRHVNVTDMMRRVYGGKPPDFTTTTNTGGVEMKWYVRNRLIALGLAILIVGGCGYLMFAPKPDPAPQSEPAYSAPAPTRAPRPTNTPTLGRQMEMMIDTMTPAERRKLRHDCSEMADGYHTMKAAGMTDAQIAATTGITEERMLLMGFFCLANETN